MRLKRSLLARQSGGLALGVNPAGKRRQRPRARTQALPYHAHQPPSLERAEVAELEIEGAKAKVDQPIGDPFDETTIGAADESDRQMQVVGGRPTKARRHLRTRRKETAQDRTLLLRHRQPEERPDAFCGRYLRAGAFVQCVGTHELGAVGRQPKCVLTESMPSATFGTWIMLISSGVTTGSLNNVSMTAAPGTSNATGNFNFGFLIPRPCMNQSSSVSLVTTSGPPSSTILPS